MKKKLFLKSICVLMSVCFVFSAALPFNTALAATKADSSQALDTQREEIERKLKAAEKKLAELGKESKETQEYIEVLDEKLIYLKQQFELAKSEVESVEKKVTSLESSIVKNKDEIAQIKDEVSSLENNITLLNDEFSSTYDAYCNRIRAIYISGNTSSVLTFLLQSNGIANLLTRYEMISAVSKQDGELLQSVKKQTERIIKVKQQLDEKRKSLSQTQIKLESDRENLKVQKSSLLQKQDEMQKQQELIEDQQLEANQLLKKLHDKTKEYGEYRDITQEELDEIDKAIEDADKKYPVQNTTTTTTTAAEKETESNSDNENSSESDETSTTKKPSTTKTPDAQSKYINLTYPCPKYTKITCGFGEYEGHTGCDFSTNHNENQKIVASESGTVILVKLLERSYGHYIVIRHDKTTSSGKSVYTLYAHNNDIIVSEGQHVSKGTQIAYSGNTGNSTGPHCHFEVRVGGSSQSNAVNPVYYLP